MKVLIINGSPRPNGNTATALSEMEQIFAAEGIYYFMSISRRFTFKEIFYSVRLNALDNAHHHIKRKRRGASVA